MSKLVIGAFAIAVLVAGVLWWFLIRDPNPGLTHSSERSESSLDATRKTRLPASVRGKEAAPQHVIGRVMTTNGDPLMGASVTVVRTSGSPETLETDESGQVVFLRSGVLSATASYSDRVPCTLRLEDHSGEAVFRLELPGSVQVTLVDPFDRPVPGVEVSVRAAQAGNSEFETVKTGATDANGKFQAEGLPPGKYDCRLKTEGRINLSAVGWESPSPFASVGLGSSLAYSNTFPIEDGENVRLFGRVSWETRIVGRLELPAGELIEGAVELFARSAPDEHWKKLASSLQVDSQGRFELHGYWTPATWEVRGSASVELDGTLHLHRYRRELAIASALFHDVGVLGLTRGLSATGVVRLRTSRGELISPERVSDWEGVIGGVEVYTSAIGRDLSVRAGDVSLRHEPRMDVQIEVPFVLNDVEGLKGIVRAPGFGFERRGPGSETELGSKWVLKERSVAFELEPGGVNEIPLVIDRVALVAFLIGNSRATRESIDPIFESTRRSNRLVVVSDGWGPFRVESTRYQGFLDSGYLAGHLDGKELIWLPYGKFRIVACSLTEPPHFFFESEWVHEPGAPAEVNVTLDPPAQLRLRGSGKERTGRLKLVCDDRQMTFSANEIDENGVQLFNVLPPNTVLRVEPGGQKVTTPQSGQSATINLAR